MRHPLARSSARREGIRNQLRYLKDIPALARRFDWRGRKRGSIASNISRESGASIALHTRAGVGSKPMPCCVPRCPTDLGVSQAHSDATDPATKGPTGTMLNRSRTVAAGYPFESNLTSALRRRRDRRSIRELMKEMLAMIATLRRRRLGLVLTSRLALDYPGTNFAAIHLNLLGVRRDCPWPKGTEEETIIRHRHRAL